jgi:transmembrane sensor
MTEARILTKVDDIRREEAAAWFSAQRRGAMSFEERARFDEWCTDRQNQAALDAIHELWDELSALKTATAPPSRSRKKLPLALAACLAVALAAGVILLSANEYIFAPSERTAIGEQRLTTLPDGSVVNLNVDSRIDYRVGKSRRDIRLDDGEALFFVHRDASRPFTVRAGGFEVRALGTAFNMRRRDGGLQIAVLEGSVSVQTLTGPRSGSELARLTAGQKISLVESGSAGLERPPELQSAPVQAMAEWRLRTVTYEDTPIREIVEDLNRFFQRPLKVSDPNVARRRVTLRLQVEDRERTLQTLSALLGVKISNAGDADAITGTT